jgi:hypothetical protein
MGVIRKKTATRGGEGGVKYVCDVCSADITSTVSASPPFDTSKHVQKLTIHTRSESDARIALATNMISVYNVSPLANSPTIISLLPIHTVSSNRTPSRYMIGIGAPMKNYCFWRGQRYTGLDHGQI